MNILLDSDENYCIGELQWLNKCESNDLNNSCEYKKMEENCKNLQTNFFNSGFNRNLKFKLDFFITGAILSYISSIGHFIFSITGIITNLLNIFIINKCKKNELKDKNKSKFSLYNFMTFLSFVNVFYCLILSFHVMNSCTVINGIFCSRLYGNVIVQYYEIYLVDFLCGILKTLSNILNIWISLFRCFIIDEKSRFFNFITKPKTVFSISFFSILIVSNIDKLTSSIVEFKDGEFDPDYYGFPMRNWLIKEDVEAITDYNDLEINMLSKNRFFFLFLINVLFNGLILWTILFISDVYLLLKFKEQLYKKFGNLFYIMSCSYSIVEKLSQVMD
ncbi:hypothetical protein BpHYR1_029699 [Brachionus plicatilis]|uniref:Uncharacterized protein n=1 Tax=Brachionus plicatilis TaxID=10195 RepID=A0A3M7T3F5_BRAPC|nr:hypothetical protein BpHYR1_029699 [Brachionus plicatilis]